MPAKKKRTTKEELHVRKSAIDALNSLTMADTRPVLDELARLRKELAEANAALAAKDKELEGFYRDAAGRAGTTDFLWSEIDRYRNSLMEHIHWDAMLPEDLREAVRKVRMEAYAWEHDEDEKP